MLNVDILSDPAQFQEEKDHRHAGDEDAQKLHKLRHRTEELGKCGRPLAVDEGVVGDGHAEHAHQQVGDGEVDEVLADVLRRLLAGQLHHQHDEVSGQGEEGREGVEDEEKETHGFVGHHHGRGGAVALIGGSYRRGGGGGGGDGGGGGGVHHQSGAQQKSKKDFASLSNDSAV
ncbi:hypothetical protein TYRP_003158 [Tyrophagus putrescentiae]|nr:hypothetical protein TYRP_003158 [Tyrophagus putrescentiae]